MHRDAVGPAVTCLTCALRAIATGLKTLQHPVLELDWHHKIQLIQASVVRGLLLFARVADGVAEKSGFVLTGKYRRHQKVAAEGALPLQQLMELNVEAAIPNLGMDGHRVIYADR